MKLIARGAEAKIILSNNLIIKDRIKKSYRIPELDEKIRKLRTRAEAKLLNKASKIINVPVPETEFSSENNLSKCVLIFIPILYKSTSDAFLVSIS